MNEPRRYNAPRRAQQAAATRQAILDAATRLFSERGYAATTVAAIAEAAQVTPKSVYAVADKAGLLMLCVDRAVVGDDDPVPLLERPEVQELLAAEPSEQVLGLARVMAPALLRLYPIYRAFEQAAASDPGLHEVWRRYGAQRRQDAEAIVTAIATGGGLRPGVPVDLATDTLWATLGWHPVALFVEERGWGVDELTAWLAYVLASLLAPPGS